MKSNSNLSPINNPLFLSTTWLQKKPCQWGYSRVDDPTRLTLEKEIALLESAKFALPFSSGTGAITSLFMLFKKDDHIICHHEIYEGTFRILNNIFKKFGLEYDLVDLSKLDELKNKIKPSTRLIFFENISNPNLKVINIKNISRLARRKNILIGVDNTIATPIFEKPLEKGADFVVHSLTKFISGHHDCLSGAIMTNRRSFFKRLQMIQQTTGAVLNPFSCHLVSRGIKTLEIRMKKHQENAKIIFDFLKKNKNIVKINFPGVSGIVSFTVSQKIDPLNFLSKLKQIKIAQSFGGTETTILHPSSMMTMYFSINKRFFRLSVGLEDSRLLISDLNKALQ